MRIRIIFLTSLTLLLIAGCGNKGPVRPFQEKLPSAVQSARILQRGAEFQLLWKAPQRNQDGTPLSDLDTVNIARLFSSEGQFCAECTKPWPVIARIQTELSAPAQTAGDLYLFSDQGATKGQTARYRLQPQNRLGDVGPVLTLKQEYRSPIAAPTGLIAVPHDRSVDLNWQPASIPTGGTLVGYQIYRRENDKPFFPLAINLHPEKKMVFSDFGLNNSSTYHYRIRSLFDFKGQLVESLPSLEVSAQPTAG